MIKKIIFIVVLVLFIGSFSYLYIYENLKFTFPAHFCGNLTSITNVNDGISEEWLAYYRQSSEFRYYEQKGYELADVCSERDESQAYLIMDVPWEDYRDGESMDYDEDSLENAANSFVIGVLSKEGEEEYFEIQLDGLYSPKVGVSACHLDTAVDEQILFVCSSVDNGIHEWFWYAYEPPYDTATLVKELYFDYVPEGMDREPSVEDTEIIHRLDLIDEFIYKKTLADFNR